MKIQINSLEALERLIGGDNQLEFDIRQSIVEAFAKKHLKSIATSDKLDNVYQAISNTISNSFMEQVNLGWNAKWVLKKEGEQLLKDKINLAREGFIDQLVAERLKSSVVLKELEETVKRRTDYITSQLTDKIIEDRINKMVDAKIRAKLNL